MRQTHFAVVLLFWAGSVPAQSLFDDIGEDAWQIGAGYSRGFNIEPSESSAYQVDFGWSRQTELDFRLYAGKVSLDEIDAGIAGAGVEYFVRGHSEPVVPSVILQVTRSMPESISPSTTAVSLGLAGTLILDPSESVRVMPSMAFGMSKAFSDPSKNIEYEMITLAELSLTVFMKSSDWKPTGVFAKPSVTFSDGDGSVGVIVGYSHGL